MTPENRRGPLFPERFVDPKSRPFTSTKWRGNLPHIYKEGGTYFVTFCLFDAMNRGRKGPERSDDWTAVAESLDTDPSIGACILRRPTIAGLVEGALLYFQGERYLLSAWCVMPNHVHCVVTPASDHDLSNVLHSWKSYTGHAINKRLNREGVVWQQESFDHFVRNPSAFERFVAYTENNPVTAGLCDRPEDWLFSSARHRGNPG